MRATARQFRSEAERRVLADRRHVSMLECAYHGSGARDRRSGFDRREILKILCSSCKRPIFGTRDGNRRLVLSANYLEYIQHWAPESLYACPHCGVMHDKQTLVQQQDAILVRQMKMRQPEHLSIRKRQRNAPSDKDAGRKSSLVPGNT